MTDSEKELRRLAESGVAHGRFAMMVDPGDLLALLDRIEALEKQALDAERKGAEEMREKAEDALYQGDPLDGRPEYAERIRSTTLPGDPT